jgi:hypothetical protein
VLSPAPAGADSVTIRSLDTSKFPTVTVDVVVNGQTPDPSTFNIVENGHYVQHLKAVPVDRASLPLGVVLAIDTSGSMTQAGKMAAARAGALELIDRKQPGDEVAVVGFGQVATVVQPFTTDVAKLHAAVAGLAPSGETALWDGLALAVGQFAGRPDIGADIVLLTDGKDTVSTSHATPPRVPPSPGGRRCTPSAWPAGRTTTAAPFIRWPTPPAARPWRRRTRARSSGSTSVCSAVWPTVTS